MKGQELPITMIVIIILFVSVSLAYSFLGGFRKDLHEWRLIRTTMMHAHLMASDYMQDDIGVVETSNLRTLKSRGYTTTYQVIAAESGQELENLDNPMNSPGEFSSFTGKVSRYALPIVFKSGSENQYGVLVVSLEPIMEWEEYEGLLPINEEMKLMWAREGEFKW